MERDEALRSSFRYDLRPQHLGGLFKASDLVFVDESHMSKKEARRKIGRSRRGKIAFQKRYKSCGEGAGCSSIAAFSIEGIQAVHVTEGGTVNSDIFMDVLNSEILPTMNAYGSGLPRSVLCLDNAAIHLKLQIIAACQQKGVLVLFLPPYSYDFNPIEKFFHQAKAYVRRVWPSDNHNVLVSERLRQALWESGTALNAIGYFRNAHIYVSPQEEAWVRSRM
jgi:hypothetical protein